MVDNGEAILQGDLVLAKDLIDRFAMLARGRNRGGVRGIVRRRVDWAVRLVSRN